MRDYARLSPRFWIGETGRQIRSGGIESQLVALYLLSSPHSNMIGLYWPPVTYIAHETGIPIEGANKALASLCESGFCQYDQQTEVVWVREMARFQVADRLKPKDKQIVGVQNAYNDVPANPFLAAFFERYREAFSMTNARAYEGASKTLGSKAQAQAQEKAQAQVAPESQATPVTTVVKSQSKPGAPTAETWAAYSRAYQRRYSAEPVRNKTVNGQLAQFVGRLGAKDAPEVAAFYVTHNKQYYVSAGHAVGPMLKDAETLHTQWVTGRTTTTTQARQLDQTQTNLSAFMPMLDAAREREAGVAHVE
jgi:hypothetical protein